MMKTSYECKVVKLREILNAYSLVQNVNEGNYSSQQSEFIRSVADCLSCLEYAYVKYIKLRGNFREVL